MFLKKDNGLSLWRIAVGAVVTLLAVLLGVFWFDIPIYNFLRGFDFAIWRYLGAVFGVRGWLILSVVVVIAFYIRKTIQTHEKFRFSNVYARVKNSYAFWVFCSVFCASFIAIILKFVIGRARPVLYGMYGVPDFMPFANGWAFHSMPSGHAVASFAGLIMIGILAPQSRWFCWLFATIIGVSRVCAGFHWPSDVVFGAFIGVLMADAARSFLARRVK